MEFIKDYRDNEVLRKSFDALAQESFGISFEQWYRSGFWTDAYNPHSLVENGEVIANISVNRMDIRVDGQMKHYIQLGTVMTQKDRRNLGLSRALMEWILKEYRDACEGFFLFANSTVLDFYPKFGFERAVCYQFEKTISRRGIFCLEKMDMTIPENWNRLIETYYANRFLSRMRVENNAQVMMFYVPDMDVYFHPGTQTYIVADAEGENLRIYDVFSKTQVTLDEVIGFFGSTVKRVILEFSPADPENYRAEPVQDEDTTFFATGGVLELLRREKLCIPTLFHA